MEHTPTIPEPLTARGLASILQETNQPLISMVFHRLGVEKCQALLSETLQIEAEGGATDQRRYAPAHTRGGLFPARQGAVSSRVATFPVSGPQGQGTAPARCAPSGSQAPQLGGDPYHRGHLRNRAFRRDDDEADPYWTPRPCRSPRTTGAPARARARSPGLSQSPPRADRATAALNRDPATAPVEPCQRRHHGGRRG